MQVNRFSGPAFNALADATCGWMLRTAAGIVEKTFDPSTVAGALRLSAASGTASPIAFDTKQKTAIILDLYPQTSTRFYASVASSQATETAELFRAVVAMSEYKLSAAELLRKVVEAAGGSTSLTRAKATVTAGLGPDNDFDLLHPWKFAQFLG